ncbi:MAG: alpha/beta hydrolase [Desulfovibrionaceae bacterium]|nr:alpha/beta hydrolase [Desulfovibrionaceae bacterium]
MRQVTLLIAIVLLLASPIQAAEAIRYFMQPVNSKASLTPYGVNDAAGHTVQADDARIYYEVYGEGKPCFIFHGGGVGSPYELGCIIDELRKNFQVIVVSTRGHGRSEIGHSPLSFEQKVADMVAVMRSVTDKAAIILGFSDGAYTAYKLASLYPEKVDRIVAIGAGTLKKGFFPADLHVSDLLQMDKGYVEQLLSTMPEPERLQEFLTAYMTFWNRMSVGEEILSTVQCPTLLVVGDEDSHAPIVTVLAAHQMIPNSRLCVVPKAWHTAFLDNWPVTWACIRQFIHADAQSLVPSKKLERNNVSNR